MNGWIRSKGRGLASPLAGATALLLCREALACGCFAPPIPRPDAQGNFAVNQRAEQIIFEVSPGMVSAHVRILYEGSPDEFAWLLPMPNVPELELSQTDLFGYVDQQTRPNVSVAANNVCPQQRYVCRTHPPCPVYTPAAPSGAASQSAAGPGNIIADGNMAAGVSAPPVTVLASARVGAYDTITFAADEADLAIQWLNDNDFIVNETMSPYMQPYLDSEMVFVASKLVPGADLDEIRPLRLTYEAGMPSIPLRLTAIAAEPHMTVTAFIYASEEFDPLVAPLVTLPQEELANSGRSNYPMLLARAVDDMGGFAFLKEYVGAGPRFVDTTGCCSTVRGAARLETPALASDAGSAVPPVASDAGRSDAGVDSGASSGGAGPVLPPEPDSDDVCYVANDGLCQCPGTPFDAADCGEDLTAAFDLAAELAEQYSVLTRLTTRISPEEMIEDPVFQPSENPAGNLRASYRGTTTTLASCEDLVVDEQDYDEIIARQACSAVYCDFGECVITEAGAGCRCDEGFVARVFQDGDGAQSITCVPETPPVDFAAGGIEIESSCVGNSVAGGECIDLGGFPGVRCDDELGAVIGSAAGGPALANCSPIVQFTSTQGATNYSSALQELDVCSQPPPSCRADGWLEEFDVGIEGVDCGNRPDESWFEQPPPPECPEPADPTAPTATVGPPSVQVPPPAPSTVDTREPRPPIVASAQQTPRSGDSGWCSLRGAPGGSGFSGFAALFWLAVRRRRTTI